MKKGIPHVKSIVFKPDGLILFFYSQKKYAKKAAAVEKFAKNQFMPLKEK